MKIEIVDGVVRAIPENQKDLSEIVKLSGKDTVAPPLIRKHRKHKKHNFMKACPQCGKVMKGKRGLAIHTVRIHKGLFWSPKVKTTPEHAHENV